MIDNRVLVNENGEESVFCNRADGLGIEMLKKKTDVGIVVLSKEKNKVVKTRCGKLNIDCVQGVDNKYDIFLKEVKGRG